MFSKIPEPFPCLANLPPLEGFEAILNAANFWSVKCSCTTDNGENTQNIFGRSHIRILETDLSHASMTELALVTSNPQIAPLIQGLLIHRGEDASLGEGFKWPRDELGQLIAPAVFIGQLVAIVSALPNCSSFAVSRAPNPVFTAVNKNFPTPSEAVTILNAVISIAGVQVGRYGTDFRLYGHSPSMKGNPVDQVSFDPIHLRDPGFRSAMEGIEVLTLKFPAGSADTVSFASSLMGSAPSLQELTIDFDEGKGAGTLMTQLVSTGPRFQLQSLTLRNGTLSGRDLWTFLEFNCATMRILHLEQIRLEENGSWLPIMGLLREGLPNLREAALIDLMSGPDAIDTWSLEFAEFPKGCHPDGPQHRRFVWDRKEEVAY
ncbi:hypothetical protein BJY01DRAFT_107006 [Aspergillus pseudoustus]|uniref:Uncharacterized protein n=1 Tax=Aspergillus pseudoustus TaxID=1810923 RepID=A0ABR4IVN9_9EURO